MSATETLVEFLGQFGLAPVDVAAPVVALVGLYVVLRFRDHPLGPRSEAFAYVRRYLYPQLSRFARRNGLGSMTRTLDAGEFVGHSDHGPADFENMLRGYGFESMNLLSSYKFAPDGTGEVASLAYRESLLADRQVHVVLFPDTNGGTRVAGHVEFNPFNPLVAVGYFMGVNYVALPDLGVDRIPKLFAPGVILAADVEG